MTWDSEDRFEERLREIAQDYHRPPPTPRDELWQRIAAARERRRPPFLLVRRWIPWGAGIAAVLALGIGIGRWTAAPAGGPAGAGVPAGAVGGAGSGALPYRLAAAEHFTRADALLTAFRAEARSGRPDRQFAQQARELLATTRLMQDSPAAEDRRLKSLLDDLEIVLAQIAQLTPGETAEDVQLITQGLEQRGVLLRLRTADPLVPGPARTEGAL